MQGNVFFYLHIKILVVILPPKNEYITVQKLLEYIE
jgi:hypothetical protein